MRSEIYMLPTPHHLSVNPAYAPFLSMTDALLLTTDELAKHWRYTKQAMHNMRRLRTGPAWLKLPGGAVRYRHSDILAYELYGHGGGLTLDRVSMALATCPDLKPAQRERIEAHLKSVLCERI